MKAAVLREPYQLSIEERPKPEPHKAGEFVVRVRAAGICGSDLSAYQGKEGWIPNERALGGVMGHEFAGEIVEGEEDETDFGPGNRVWIDPLLPCGRCEMCKRGQGNLCKHLKAFGHSYLDDKGEYVPYEYGGFEEYIVAPEGNLHLLPESIDFGEAALVEPLSNAVHLVNKASVSVEDEVAIFGAGVLGLTILQTLVHSGVGKTFVVDLKPSRLSLAKTIGGKVTINSSQVDPVEAILEETSGRGVDKVVEAVGITETYCQSIEVATTGGTVMALGNTESAAKLPIWPGIVNKELSFLGSHAWESWEPERSIKLLSSGGVDLEPLITHTFPLEYIQKGFETLDKDIGNPVKVVIIP